MKPLQIALLVVAGAVGGAIVMKVTQRPQPVAPAAVVAQGCWDRSVDTCQVARTVEERG